MAQVQIIFNLAFDYGLSCFLLAYVTAFYRLTVLSGMRF
jgi:hypothetical protein